MTYFGVGPNRSRQLSCRQFDHGVRLYRLWCTALMLVVALLLPREAAPFLPTFYTAEATAVYYHGSVYHGLTEEMVRAGGSTFSIEVSIPAFPSNATLLHSILVAVLTANVRLIDDDGNILQSFDQHSLSYLQSMSSRSSSWTEWRHKLSEALAASEIKASANGHKVHVVLAPAEWTLPPHSAALVVPCLPFSLFERMERLGLHNLPNNCLAGDPFIIRKMPFLRLDGPRWRRMTPQFVTGGLISIPLLGVPNMPLEKLALEKRLQVMEGYTCLHTRRAHVRGSRWDTRENAYRFTPHRGGLQTLCYTPYPENLPFLRIKMADSYEVAGPEGVSTDPPQVHIEMEFTGTIYGTNLTERDTAVITDELCADFTSQNVFFVDLFFSSSSRVSFFGTFHQRGIYHICYHREGSPAYVRVSTLLVERGTEIVIDNSSSDVLIDQEVKLRQATSVARLKVQERGNLNLRHLSINVAKFIWTGGTISGKGTLNCTGYAKITTQAYETRQLLVPLYNYGEMTIDVQRLVLERDGAIHNYGNLTLAVSSMGSESISSYLSMGRDNSIINYPGAILRIIALDERSFALLTGRFLFHGGVVFFSGKFNITDCTSVYVSNVILKSGTTLTVQNTRFIGAAHLEEQSTLIMLGGSVLISLNVTGSGTIAMHGSRIALNTVAISGNVTTLVGREATEVISVIVYGTLTFGPHTLVSITTAIFTTFTGLAKVMLNGQLMADYHSSRFTGNIILQIGGLSVLYGDMSTKALIPPSSPQSSSTIPLVTSSFIMPSSTVYIIDTQDLISSEALPLKDHEQLNTTISQCETFIPTSLYLTMSGRLLLRGCLQVPSGGVISGPVSKLHDPKDWSILIESICVRAMTETLLPQLPSFCKFQELPPLRHSGLSLSDKIHIRRPAAILVDEVLLVSSNVRVADTLPFAAIERLIITADSTLHFSSSMSVTSQHAFVEGTLVLNDPRRTLFTGNVEVFEGGIVELHGVDTRECFHLMNVEGNLKVHGTIANAYRCVSKTDDEAAGKQLDGTSTLGVNGDLSTMSSGRSDSNLRRRVMANFPSTMECTMDVMAVADERKRFVEYYWLLQAYDPPPDQPARGSMILMSLFGLASAAIVFTALLQIWGLTCCQWWEDLNNPFPLHLTLSWEEFSYRAVNHASLFSFIIIQLQNLIGAFHPGLPAPLPSVLLTFTRSIGLLMPHHQTPLLRTRAVGIIYIVWLIIFLLWQRFSTLLLPIRQRHPFFIRVAGHVYTILILFNAVFFSPIMSSVLEGVVWPTLLRNVPTYEPLVFDWKVLLSVVSFLSMGIVTSSGALAKHFQVSPMDLHIRVSWTLFTVPIEMVQVTLWKVFYNSPISTVITCLCFQLIRIFILQRRPPTPYINVNRFMFWGAAIPLIGYTTILFYLALVYSGIYKNCTQGAGLFIISGGALVVSLGANFVRNILLEEEQIAATGDAGVDALQCSIIQTRNRIYDLKLHVFSCSDSVERENTLNAIARLRITLLEKQEQCKYEVYRIVRPFIFGRANCTLSLMPKDGTNSLPSILHDKEGFNSFMTEASLVPSASQHHSSSLLTAEEMETVSCGPQLGKGSYGTVHLGILTNGKFVAVKYVSVVNGSKEALSTVKAEVDVLRELSHRNIIRYYGVHTIQDTMLIFMEFAVGGSLTSVAKKFKPLSEAVIQLYAFQILKGLQYLHGKGVVHRDIKGENILIDGDGAAKLADFGCSKLLANIANASQVGCGTLVGSPFWMAPEVIRSEAYGTKADIWSVGCTVVEILNGGEPPWREDFDNVYSAMFYVGSTNDIPQIPDDTSEECRDFLFRCFERDVSHRASADELLQHPWLETAAAAQFDDGTSECTSGLQSLSVTRLKSPVDINKSSPHGSRPDLTSDASTSLGYFPPSL